VDVVRYLDSTEGRTRPLVQALRPLVGLAVKLRRLILGEKHWL
jgi:hypothetical protein